MKKPPLHPSSGHQIVDPKLAAMERMDRYCTAHPGSPSAVRSPHLMTRGQLWIALLGASVQNGIIGIGPTVEAALRAFDAQYLGCLRPSPGSIKRHRNTSSPRN